MLQYILPIVMNRPIGRVFDKVTSYILINLLTIPLLQILCHSYSTCTGSSGTRTSNTCTSSGDSSACTCTDSGYHAIILAVAHEQFKQINYKELLAPNGIIYDVKG